MINRNIVILLTLIFSDMRVTFSRADSQQYDDSSAVSSVSGHDYCSSTQDSLDFPACAAPVKPPYMTRLKEKGSDYMMIMLFYYLRCKEYLLSMCMRIKGLLLHVLRVKTRSHIKE